MGKQTPKNRNILHSAIANYFSPEELVRIRQVIVGIAGLGGLGSNCAMNLVRSGFERFVFADFDRVAPSNLNRQVYFPRHIGRLKTESLQEILAALHPSIHLEMHSVRIDASNVLPIFGQCDVIVEAFDRPESKALIVEAFIDTAKVIVGASGLAGFGESDRIVTRRVRDNFYLIGDAVSEVHDRLKPYAPCVAIAAAKQADVVLSVVLSSVRKDGRVK